MDGKCTAPPWEDGRLIENSFFVVLICFETGSCDVVLIVLELYIDEAGLKLTDISLPLPPRITGVATTAWLC